MVQIRDTLMALIRKDQTLINDRRRLESMLKDYHPQGGPELNAICQAQRAGVPAMLISSGSTNDKSLLLERAMRKLTDDSGLREKYARFAVESWALALGVVDERSLNKPATVTISSEPKAKVPTPAKKDVLIDLGSSRTAPSPMTPPLRKSVPQPAYPPSPPTAATSPMTAAVPKLGLAQGLYSLAALGTGIGLIFNSRPGWGISCFVLAYFVYKNRALATFISYIIIGLLVVFIYMISKARY